MTWRGLLIVVFWMVLALLLAREWYVNLELTRHVPRSAVESLEGGNQPVRPPSAANIQIESYDINKTEGYRYEATLTVRNRGGTAAKNIRIYVTPWHHAMEPGTDEKEIDPNLPIWNEGKYLVIDLLKPGEQVTQVLHFEGVDYAEPRKLQTQEPFKITFDADVAK
jgi:hypothetical protein